VEKTSFSRKHKLFVEEELKQLKKYAAENGVTMAALLCTAYGKVLKHWSNQRRFAINLTVFNRLPFHEDVNNIIGDFTSVILIDCDLKEKNFIDQVKGVQEKILSALEHRHYDGVEFIRDLAKENNMINQVITPIVFTDVGDNYQYENENEEIAYEPIMEEFQGITQTSQVYLDNQVAQRNGQLSIVWDYIQDIFEE
ncbi:condensation domain-containing protein, partial [Vallitalea longa]|uniref:condensation domain-containing protein n=1 Tax=Vallitalea longa TaxID=2936439 RepID=UPI002491B20D